MKSFKRIASAAIALMLFVSGPFSTLNAETRALNVVKSSAEIISNTYHLKISDIVLESGEEFNSLKKVSNYKEACDNGVLSSELAGKSEFKVVEVPVDISSQAGFTDASMDFVLDQELTLVGYKSDENGTAMTLNNCSVISDGTHVSIKGDNNACVTENGTLLTLLIALPDNYTADKSYEVGINEETIRASMPEIPSEESIYKIESGNITVRSAYILEIEKTVKDYDSLKTASEYSNIYTSNDMSEIRPEYEEYKNNKVIEVPVNMLVNAGINTGSIKFKCNTGLTFIGCLTDKNGKIITLDTTLECGVNTKKLLINNDMGTECTNTGKLATLLFILPDDVKLNYKYGISFKKDGFNFVANQTIVSGIDGYAMVKSSKPEEPTKPETDDPQNDNNPDYVLQIEKTVKNYQSLKNVSEYANAYNEETKENNIKPEYEEYKNNKVIEVPLNMLVNAGINTGTIKLEFDENLIFIGCLSDKNGKLTTLDTILECGVNTQKLLINNDMGTMCTKTGKLATLLFILPEDVEMDHEYNINFKKDGFNFVSEKNKVNGINGYAMVTLSDTPSTPEPEITTVDTDVTTPDCTTQNTVKYSTQTDTDADYCLQIEKTEKKYNSLKSVSQYRNAYAGGYITGGNMKEQYMPYQDNKVIEVPVNMLVNSGISTGIISFDCDPDLKFMGCLTDQDGTIITIDTTINCGINAQKILFNNDQGKKCVKTGTLATLLFILPDNIKMDYKYNVSFSENGFDFVTEKKKIQGINGYAMVTDSSNVTTAEPQETQNKTTDNTENNKNADYVLEIEKIVKDYDSLKCASQYSNLYNGDIAEENIKPEYEEFKNNKVIEVPVNMLVNAGINTGTIKFEFDNDLIFIGCLTDETGKLITLDTTLECGVNTKKLLINNDGGTKCIKTGKLATLLFILPENAKINYRYNIDFKENGFNFVTDSSKINGINGYAMLTTDKPVTTEPKTPENPTTDTTENEKNADFVLEIEKTEKKYNSLKKVSEYTNVYNGEISEKNIKPEYEEYKNNKVIEVPVNMLVNAGINTGTIKLECDNDLIFIGCLTDKNGKIVTLDTTLGCGVNTKKLLINNDGGAKCVQTGKLAVLLFILPEDVKMDYKYSVNFKKDGFNFVSANNKVRGINGYAMVTDGFEETTVSPQVTDQPTTSLSQTYGDADYVLEIEKTIKNYNSLKKVSEYKNVYTGGNIEEGKIKLEYEEYKNNRVIEVPMNILVNSGITAGIISFNCAPELKFIGCITNEDGAVITLDTSISCGINAQKILFNSDKGDKCVKTGTLSTLLFILPEDVKMDYEYNVNFEENGFDFVANKKTILGIDGYAMVTLDNNVTDKTDVTKNVTGTESDNNQTSTYNATDKTGTEVNTITDKTGTEVNTITDKTGTEVNTITDKTGTEVNTITDKTGTEVNTITDKTGTKVNTSTEKTGTEVNTTTDKTGTKVNTSTEKTGTKVNTTTEKTGTKVNTSTEKTGTKVNTTTEKTGTKVNTSTEKTGTKVNTTTEKIGTKVNTSTEKTGTKVNTSTEKTGTEVNTITDKTGTEVNTITDKTGTKVNTSTEKTGTKVNTITEKTGTKINTNTEKTGTDSGSVTQVTTTPINTDVTTVPTDSTIPVNTTKLNENKENTDKPIDGNDPPVIIRCDNIIIVQGTKIIIVSVKLQNFNIKSYFQETVIDFSFNNYFSISDIELNYQIKTVSTRYEIIGNQVHLYNIDTTRLSSDAELFKVDIDTQNNIPVGEYNMDLNASAKRAVDYINEDGVKKEVYSEISSVKGGESTIQIKEKSSSVKEIVPGSVKITNPYKKFYYSHLNDKIDMSGLKVTADIITTYDNGQQSTEYGVDITNKISISDKAVPSKLYNDNAFRYSIDLIYTDAEIAPVGKKVGSFNVLIGELGDVTLDHEVDVVDSTILLREAAKSIVGMSMLDTVLNESKSQLEYGVYESMGEENMIDFMKFLGNIYIDGEMDVVDSTLILRFSALSAVADVKGKPLDRLSTWGKLLSI